jgi:hypothetical protein
VKSIADERITKLVNQTSAAYVTLVVSDSEKAHDGTSTRAADRRGKPATSGSGFVVDSSGYVVTAAHVALEKGNSVSARAANGRVYSGTVVDVLPSNDIALIRLRGYSGITVTPARNACLATGNFIYSLGRPHDQGNTVRVGSVQSTSFGRPVSYGKFGYPDAIVLDLEALKAQIETLNSRVAAMEAAPAVPVGYQLIAVSEGELEATPGLGFSARELAGYGSKSTVISVLPAADAPAGTTISWSGYARAGLVYSNSTEEITVTDDNFSESYSSEDSDVDNSDVDVRARGQLRVKASTDTAVGEVGVDIRLRGNFNGNGNADVYSDVAWGYWAMTPELTFGGGYAGSLGNIGYGYDGACNCYYTDNADLAFDPGDTSQMRLSYASGPLAMAVALEDASLAGDSINGDQLGVAGELKYSGDAVNGEISAVYHAFDETDDFGDNIDLDWQVGAGIGFNLGEMASISLAAAMGEGPFTVEVEGEITDGAPVNQDWWGVSGLVSVGLTDAVHAEAAAGYKSRDFEVPSDSSLDYDTYGMLAGIYYSPVDQLTIGIEGEWYTTDTHYTEEDDQGDELEVELETENMSLDLVTVWRF